MSFMSNNDEQIKQAVAAHLKEIKLLAVELGVYKEEDINQIPLDDLIKFALSYQIVWLDKMLRDQIEIRKTTTTNLRLYNEMCKVIIGIKQTVKSDNKLNINDPIKALQESLKKSMKKEIK